MARLDILAYGDPREASYHEQGPACGAAGVVLTAWYLRAPMRRCLLSFHWWQMCLAMLAQRHCK